MPDIEKWGLLSFKDCVFVQLLKINANARARIAQLLEFNPSYFMPNSWIFTECATLRKIDRNRDYLDFDNFQISQKTAEKTTTPLQLKPGQPDCNIREIPNWRCASIEGDLAEKAVGELHEFIVQLTKDKIYILKIGLKRVYLIHHDGPINAKEEDKKKIALRPLATLVTQDANYLQLASYKGLWGKAHHQMYPLSPDGDEMPQFNTELGIIREFHLPYKESVNAVKRIIITTDEVFDVENILVAKYGTMKNFKLIKMEDDGNFWYSFSFDSVSAAEAAFADARTTGIDFGGKKVYFLRDYNVTRRSKIKTWATGGSEEIEPRQENLEEVDRTEEAGISDEVHHTEEAGVSDEVHHTEEAGISDMVHHTEEAGISDEVHHTEEAGISDMVHHTEEAGVSDEVDQSSGEDSAGKAPKRLRIESSQSSEASKRARIEDGNERELRAAIKRISFEDDEEKVVDTHSEDDCFGKPAE